MPQGRSPISKNVRVTARLAREGMWLDVGGIRTLVSSDGSGGWVAIVLLGFGFSVTFGSLAMGSAVFMLPRGDDVDDPPRPLPLLLPDQVPVRSAARTRSRWKV